MLLLYNTVSEILTNAIRKRKQTNKKGVKIRRGKENHHIYRYVHLPGKTNSAKEQLEQIREFNKDAEYKMKLQPFTAYLYAINN